LNNETSRFSDEKNTTTSVSDATTTEVENADAVDVEGNEPELSPEEEKVIRMLYGKSLDGQEALKFAPGASADAVLKLAMIERYLLDLFEADALEPDPSTGNPRSVLASRLD
jgi:hypothetical protein